MRVRYQADPDLDGRILRGLRRVPIDIDFRTASDAGLEGLDDSEVLRTASESARILLARIGGQCLVISLASQREGASGLVYGAKLSSELRIALRDVIPIDDAHDRCQVVRPAVLIFEVVGVFPNVDSKQGAAVGQQRAVLIGSGVENQLPVRIQRQPGPTATGN